MPARLMTVATIDSCCTVFRSCLIVSGSCAPKLASIRISIFCCASRAIGEKRSNRPSAAINNREIGTIETSA